jgi:hypothetical protein
MSKHYMKHPQCTHTHQGPSNNTKGRSGGLGFGRCQKTKQTNPKDVKKL